MIQCAILGKQNILCVSELIVCIWCFLRYFVLKFHGPVKLPQTFNWKKQIPSDSSSTQLSYQDDKPFATGRDKRWQVNGNSRGPKHRNIHSSCFRALWYLSSSKHDNRNNGSVKVLGQQAKQFKTGSFQIFITLSPLLLSHYLLCYLFKYVPDGDALIKSI